MECFQTLLRRGNVVADESVENWWHTRLIDAGNCVSVGWFRVGVFDARDGRFGGYVHI